MLRVLTYLTRPASESRIHHTRGEIVMRRRQLAPGRGAALIKSTIHESEHDIFKPTALPYLTSALDVPSNVVCGEHESTIGARLSE